MIDLIQTLWGYHVDRRRKLCESLMTVSDEDFKRPVDYSVGSLKQQMVHTMWAEALWYSRVHGEPRPNFNIDDFADCNAVHQQWEAVNARWQATIDTITEAELMRAVHFSRQNGDQHSHLVRDIILQIINHGTDHTAQMLQLVHSYGGQTFEQDISFYLRKHKIHAD
jgi:uncharacterized damage-inducible protein DinB